MVESLILKSDKTPSYFNKDTLIGALIPGLNLIGVIVGAVFGKNRMEEERAVGKVVSDKPSFWNKDSLLGGLVGIWSGAAAAYLAPAFLAPVIFIGAITLGTYIGGKSGEVRMAHEYATAKKQTIIGHLSKNVSPEVAKAVEYSMEHNKDWGKEVSEDRLLAEARGRSIS